MYPTCSTWPFHLIILLDHPPWPPHLTVPLNCVQTDHPTWLSHLNTVLLDCPSSSWLSRLTVPVNRLVNRLVNRPRPTATYLDSLRRNQNFAVKRTCVLHGIILKILFPESYNSISRGADAPSEALGVLILREVRHFLNTYHWILVKLNLEVT